MSACENCGKEWLHGDCTTTVARRGLCASRVVLQCHDRTPHETHFMFRRANAIDVWCNGVIESADTPRPARDELRTEEPT